jgi:hypothetical protein
MIDIDLLFKPEVVPIVSIQDQAYKIYLGSYHNKNDTRDPETRIAHAILGKSVEHALFLKGCTYNPLEHDPSNPESFAWDVMFNGEKTEVKRMILSKKDCFLSYDDSKYKTFKTHQSIVSGFIGATTKYSKCKTFITVQVRLLTTPECLFNNSVKTKYQDVYGFNNFYFDHVHAPKDQYIMCPKLLERGNYGTI